MISEQTCEAMASVLGHSLWQGVAVAGAFLAFRAVVRGSRPRYVAGVAAMGLMVIAPLATSMTMASGHAAGKVSAISRVATPSTPLPPSHGEASRAEHPAPVEFPAPPASVDTTVAWSQRLVAAYLAGAAMMLARLAMATAAGRRVRAGAERVSDSGVLAMAERRARAVGLTAAPVVATCGRAVVPCVVGVIRPMILLPAGVLSGLMPEELEAVVAHELAHVRRYDPAFNLLQRLVEAAMFYHPAVWWVSRCVRADRELCCDDVVVGLGIAPERYARALVRVSELCAVPEDAFTPQVALGAVGRKSALRARVERLLGVRTTAELRPSRAGMMLAAVLAIAATASLTHRQARSQTTAAARSETMIAGKVLTPDGSPAKGASVFVATPGSRAQIVDGQLVAALESGTAVDAEGRFSAAKPGGPFRVYAMSEQGIGEASAEEIAANGTIQLKAWARVSGVLKVNGKLAAAGAEVSVNSMRGSRRDDAKLSIMSTAKTDAEGRFVCGHVAPGPVMVARMAQVGAKNWQSASSVKTEVAPGDNKAVDIGNNGRPVVGKVTYDAGLPKGFRIGRLSASTALARRPMPDNLLAMTRDEQQKWFADWRASDAGKAFLAEEKRQMAARKSYPGRVNEDGTFQLDDVLPGRYVINDALVSNMAETKGLRVRVFAEFTVPEERGEEANGPLDIGTARVVTEDAIRELELERWKASTRPAK